MHNGDHLVMITIFSTGKNILFLLMIVAWKSAVTDDTLIQSVNLLKQSASSSIIMQ